MTVEVRAVWATCVCFVVAVLVVLPFHMQVARVEVKCGAPVLAASVPDAADRCREPAEQRLVAAVVLSAITLVPVALRRRRRNAAADRGPVAGSGANPRTDQLGGDADPLARRKS